MLWPWGVVEDLELVDVDHQDADAVLGAAAPGEQRAELVEVAAVRQARERVGRGPGLGLAMGVGPGEGGRCLDGGAGKDPLADFGHGSAVRRETTIAPTTPAVVVSGAASVCLRP
jgi:hypothetical protein